VGALGSRSLAGSAIGYFKHPLELKVLEVGRDYLLALREDETGMQVSVAYRLLRGTES
jgi:hypothetical protein